jgi:hypothetical protein
MVVHALPGGNVKGTVPRPHGGEREDPARPTTDGSFTFSEHGLGGYNRVVP